MDDTILQDLDKSENEHKLILLTNGVNKIFKEKHIPKENTTGRLIAFSKIPDDIPKANETRPIVTLSPIMKLLEALVVPALRKIVNDQVHVPKEQTGFKNKHTTHMNILLLCTTMLTSQKNLHSTDYYFFADYCKAFDSVHHTHILDACW